MLCLSVPDQHRDGVSVQTKMLHSAPAGGTDDAKAMGVVDDQPCVVRLAARASSSSGPMSPSMLNTPSVATTEVVSECSTNADSSSSSIRVREAFKARSRQQPTIDEGRVAEPIQQHGFATPGQRGHHGEVRHVTRGEQQRAFAPGEGSELLFQPRVLGSMAGHQM